MTTNQCPVCDRGLKDAVEVQVDGRTIVVCCADCAKAVTEAPSKHIMANTALTAQQLDFYERFKSFWAAPSGPRVAEIISPDAKIHFTGNATMSGTDYIDFMTGMLAAFPGMTVTPLDCAGSGSMLYIAWETASVIHGKPRKFLGVDRFRIVNGMAVEEHIIFDSAVLQPEGRPGIDR